MQNNNIEERIVCQARRIFMEKGYAATSMSDIAEASGLTRSCLHYYYHTKDSLFHAVFASIIESFVPKIEEIMTADRPIEERLEHLVDIYVDKIKENPDLPLFLIREVNRDADHFVEAFDDIGMKQYFLRIGRHLQKEMEEGKLKQVPIPIVTFTFYGQLLIPFVFRGVAESIMSVGDDQYSVLLNDWKPYFVSQLSHLLKPETTL